MQMTESQRKLNIEQTDNKSPEVIINKKDEEIEDLKIIRFAQRLPLQLVPVLIFKSVLKHMQPYLIQILKTVMRL